MFLNPNYCCLDSSCCHWCDALTNFPQFPNKDQHQPVTDIIGSLLPSLVKYFIKIENMNQILNCFTAALAFHASLVLFLFSADSPERICHAPQTQTNASVFRRSILACKGVVFTSEVLGEAFCPPRLPESMVDFSILPFFSSVGQHRYTNDCSVGFFCLVWFLFCSQTAEITSGDKRRKAALQHLPAQCGSIVCLFFHSVCQDGC